MAIRLPDIEAAIMFVPAENGGRRSIAISGYRSSHDFGLGTTIDASHQYLGRETVVPGEIVRTNMWFLAPLCQDACLHPGMKFTVQEGAHVVGHGVVIKIISKTLERVS